MLCIATGGSESELVIPEFPNCKPEEVKNIWSGQLGGVNRITHLLNRIKKGCSGPLWADRGKSGRMQVLKRGAFGS